MEFTCPTLNALEALATNNGSKSVSANYAIDIIKDIHESGIKQTDIKVLYNLLAAIFQRHLDHWPVFLEHETTDCPICAALHEYHLANQNHEIARVA